MTILIWAAIVLIVIFTIFVIINTKTESWFDWYILNSFVEAMLQLIFFLLSLLTGSSED